MTLADKIARQRKRAGLSQEGLAARLGVSRQAVSKWESGQSVPDVDRIVTLSEVFGVSTDYLLKDEEPGDSPAGEARRPGEAAPANHAETPDVRTHAVSPGEAADFLANNRTNATLVALGVALCILSPVTMLVLVTLSEPQPLAPVDPEMAIGLGLAALLVMVTVAVGIFVTRAMRSRRFQHLRQDLLDVPPEVSEGVRRQREAAERGHAAGMATGVVLCVAAAIPVVLPTRLGDLTGPLDLSVAALCEAAVLALVALGVSLIVRTRTVWSGFDVLLEEGDYTREAKRVNARVGGIYWAAVTALYLLVSFLTMAWSITWVIWPVAGTVYGIVAEAWRRRNRQ